MNRSRRTAIFAIAAIAVGAAAPAADAVTVGPGANNELVSLVSGDTLTIKLKPGDSGSSGYHWRVARKPAKSVLRLVSRRTTGGGARQVFTLRARNSGGTSLELQYVAPGRRARVVKSYALSAIVNSREPKIACNEPTGFGSTAVASDSKALVFKVRRSIVVAVGHEPKRVAYDAYYGCDRSQSDVPAFRLGGVAGAPGPVMFSNVTLRGTIVGYVVQFRCPLFDGNGCDIDGSTFESQDLHSGKVIRSIAVGGGGITANNGFDGPVVSATGGLAWIEREAYSPYDTVVLRSDSPVTDPRAAIEPDRLDEGPTGTIDPDSLGFDGTDMTWRRDGVLKRAPLR